MSNIEFYPDFNVKTFFDEETYTLTYVVWDPKSHDGVIIDSVLNYDHASGKISDESLDQLKDKLKECNTSA